MKIREVIQEFMPCEVCGNRDIHKFYFHVFVHKGSQPYVKCCECEEEYYSTRARKIITKIEDVRTVQKDSYKNIFEKDNSEPSRSVVDILRGL
ncbi:MAG: hypothetical protein ABIF85_01270 [Nanoarchaeota archaeon]|nr:hypothetical protein [Nanoarchaeota archaeon]MBU4451296.1 hypothetical protein [Nanoarchaeota archaeon]MCG2723585.1 hypothetical protein [archaeon]